MENSIYMKLQKMRTSIKNSEWGSFPELVELVDKVAKRNKVIVLYCFYDKLATLSLIDMDNIAMCVKFQLPAELTNMRQVRQQLYCMALNLTEADTVINTISARELLQLLERMKKKGVTELEVCERYHVPSLADLTVENYTSCLSVLNKMHKSQEANNG